MSGNNIVIIGDSKTGKTRSLSTLPGRSVIANFDPAGYKSLTVPYSVVRPGEFKDCKPDDNIKIIVIDYTSLIKQITLTTDRTDRKLFSYNMYTAFVRDMNEAIESPHVDNIVVDGLTGLSDVVLEAVLQSNKRTKPVFEDWGQAIEKIAEIAMALASSPKNFILNCHIQTEKDEVTGRIKELPLVYGKQLPNRLLAIFDTVFITRVSNNIYHWLTTPQPLIQTVGSRSFQNLPPAITQDYKLLFDNKPQAVTASGR